jgi:hypothetical protein
MRNSLVSHRCMSVLTAAACSAIASYAQCGPFGCPPCFSNPSTYFDTSGGTQDGVTVINVGVVPCGPNGCTTTEYNTIASATQDAISAWNSAFTTLGHSCLLTTPYILKWATSDFDLPIFVKTTISTCSGESPGAPPIGPAITVLPSLLLIYDVSNRTELAGLLALENSAFSAYQK